MSGLVYHSVEVRPEKKHGEGEDLSLSLYVLTNYYVRYKKCGGGCDFPRQVTRAARGAIYTAKRIFLGLT